VIVKSIKVVSSSGPAGILNVKLNENYDSGEDQIIFDCECGFCMDKTEVIITLERNKNV